MDKYILIKCVSGANGISSCYISGMTLEEICHILKTPSELLLTYNEFNDFCRVNKDDFLCYARNRSDYHTIVCSDINDRFICKSITKHDAKDLLNFADICTPTPVLWLPSIADNFCIYSHDESLYSYMCFKMSPKELVKNFLNWLISSSKCESAKEFNGADCELFLKEIFHGIYVDTENIEIFNDTLSLLVSGLNIQTDFSSNIFSEELPVFEHFYIKVYPEDSSMSSSKTTE